MHNLYSKENIFINTFVSPDSIFSTWFNANLLKLANRTYKHKLKYKYNNFEWNPSLLGFLQKKFKFIYNQSELDHHYERAKERNLRLIFLKSITRIILRKCCDEWVSGCSWNGKIDFNFICSGIGQSNNNCLRDDMKRENNLLSYQ